MKSLVRVAAVGWSRRRPVLIPSLVSCQVSVIIVHPIHRLRHLLVALEAALLSSRPGLSRADLVLVMRASVCVGRPVVLLSSLVGVGVVRLGAGR